MFGKDEIDPSLEEEESNFEYYKVDEEPVEVKAEPVTPVAKAPKNFKQTFPTIEDLKNTWSRANDKKKQEIAELAGSKDLDIQKIKEIWRNA